jgi:hypothetical protein
MHNDPYLYITFFARYCCVPIILLSDSFPLGTLTSINMITTSVTMFQRIDKDSSDDSYIPLIGFTSLFFCELGYASLGLPLFHIIDLYGGIAFF